jgi:hypothetical protein
MRELVRGLLRLLIGPTLPEGFRSGLGALSSKKERYRNSHQGKKREEPNANPSAQKRRAEHELSACLANEPLVHEGIAFDQQECDGRTPKGST